MTVAWDIIDATMDRLIELIEADMCDDLEDEDDPLKLDTVEKYPLHEDPTTSSPFVVVAHDPDKGRVIDPVHEEDIGGGLRWWSYYWLYGWVPEHSEKHDCYASINKLRDRALRVILKHPNLDGLVAGNGERLFGGTWNIIDRTWSRVFGGDGQWYGEFKVEFHLMSEESPDMRGL